MEFAVGAWFLVKYVPDLKRREPRNIGVALLSEAGWTTRFVGAEDGVVSGRLPHGMSRDSYGGWLSYFQRKAEAGAWDEVLAHQSRRPINYLAEFGGVQIEAPDDPRQTMDALFDALVRTQATRPSGDLVDEAVRRTFSVAGIVPEAQPEVPVIWTDGGTPVTSTFDFGYQNGRYHAMSVLRSRRASEMHVAAINGTINAAKRANGDQNYIVFFAGSQFERDRLDELLTPLWQLSNTIDVDDPEQAGAQVASMMQPG